MANIVLFEYDSASFDGPEARSALDNTDHIITAEASTRDGAFEVMHGILANEVSCDVLVTSGTLNPMRDRGSKEFIHVLPLDPNAPVRAHRTMFGRTKGLPSVEREIVIYEKQQGPGTNQYAPYAQKRPTSFREVYYVNRQRDNAHDGAFIAKIIEVCKLDIPIIGVSLEGLADRDYCPVDLDILKYKSSGPQVADLGIHIDNLLQK